MPRPKRLPVPPPRKHERSHGEGTIREVRPGVWRAWRERVRSPDGTVSRPSRTFAGPDAQADAALWARGEPQTAVLYLGQWLERWLALRKPTISRTTYLLYRAAVAACEPLYLRPLADVTVDEWQTLTNSLLERWSRYHVFVWRGNITTAIRAAMPEHLAVNPLERVKLPKAQEEPPKAWRQDEVDRLLTAVDGTTHEAWVMFCLGTGVRHGESRALLWEDVNLTEKIATIRASFDNATNRRGPTKTRRIRVIDIPDSVIPYLAAHRKRQPPVEQLVFGHDGKPYRPSTFREWLRRRTVTAKIRDLPPHSFRHTYASLAIDAGVPITDIARQLGHTVQTCQRTYAWWIGDGQRRSANAIDAALRHRFSGPKRAARANNGTRDEA